MVLGIDLNDRISQISYMENSNEAPIPLSAVAGGEAYEIPTALGKLPGVNSWVWGEDAKKKAENEGVLLADNLCTHALNCDTVTIDGEEFDSRELLLLFLKKILSLTSMTGSWQAADGIALCMDKPDERSVGLMDFIRERLEYPAEKVILVSRMESFYEYILHQKEELWQHDVFLLDYSDYGVKSGLLSVDRRTRPAACRIAEGADPMISISDERDFIKYCEAQMEGRIVTSVYLVGDNLDESNAKGILRYLCMKRRVFQGRNLYSKGACLAAWDRSNESELTKAFLFLGDDKLKSNIGLRVMKGREETYESLVNAGVNWYDVKVSRELYLGRERELRLLLTPLTGKNEHYAVVRLADIPGREEHTTRVRLSLKMTDAESLCVFVEDLGFGEIFPSSGVKVTDNILLRSED